MGALSRLSFRLSCYTRQTCVHLSFLRFYSTSRSPERVTVPCKNNGHITLDIHRAVAGTPSSQKVLLYLPKGPPLISPQSEKSSREGNERSKKEGQSVTAEKLCRISELNVVQINYRLSSRHKFPAPVHDVLTGYDWVVQNLLASSSPTEQQEGGRSRECSKNPSWTDFQKAEPERDQQYWVGVYGEHIGGTLALSLALTECRLLESPSRVVAAVAKDPIVDWVLPPHSVNFSSSAQAESEPEQPRKKSETNHHYRNDSKINTTARDSFIRLRERCFNPHRPADHFDPFASPILFFRTAGIDVATQSEGEELDWFDVSSAWEDDPNPHASLDIRSNPSSGSGDTLHKSQNSAYLYPADSDFNLGGLDDNTSRTTTPIDKERENISANSNITQEDSGGTTPPQKTTSKHTKATTPTIRKFPRKYPPKSMEPVSLPSIKLLVSSEQHLLKSQNEEMITLLRRAFVKHNDRKNSINSDPTIFQSKNKNSSSSSAHHTVPASNSNSTPEKEHTNPPNSPQKDETEERKEYLKYLTEQAEQKMEFFILDGDINTDTGTGTDTGMDKDDERICREEENGEGKEKEKENRKERREGNAYEWLVDKLLKA